MGYVNINGQARVFVQTGMDNTRQDAGVSAQALSKTLGGVGTDYINNGTEGLGGDVGEYLPNSLSKRDVLNEYTERTLNAQGPTGNFGADRSDDGRQWPLLPSRHVKIFNPGSFL